MSKDFLKSRKFWATIAGVLTAVLVEIVPPLADLQGALGEIIVILGLYIVSTGLADFGKHAAERGPLPPFKTD